LFHNIKFFLKFQLMISRINYAVKNIKYLIFAGHKKGHGIHSPFLYNLVKGVFNKKDINPELQKVLEFYKTINASDELVEFENSGAGSAYGIKKSLTLSQIIHRSGISIKYGKLLFNLVNHFKPETILELGTSVGISSAFIGSAAKEARFITIDASETKLNKAKELSENLGLKNIRFVKGDFDEVLESVLLNTSKLDFVFIDGNHKKEPTLKYFEQCLNKSHNNSVFIFDDIHWSDDMEKAWDEIKRNPKVRVSIDIFRMGIIFFCTELSYQHYVIKF